MRFNVGDLLEGYNCSIGVFGYRIKYILVVRMDKHLNNYETLAFSDDNTHYNVRLSGNDALTHHLRPYSKVGNDEV